ncbi:MAG TPA: c-type cytochrome [Burkholderiales bacterium]|nr:c-type cytochrome [Burkholderiales bacterium]
MNRIVVLLAVAVFAASAEAQPVHDKPDIGKGEAIAKQICSACHGEDGNSTSPANPRLAGQLPDYIHKQLVNFKAGSERKNVIMLGMVSNLSEADMLNVATYYSGQKPKTNPQDKKLPALGRDIYRGGDPSRGLAACAACHGPYGAGLPANYPRLAGQSADYTESQLKAFRSGERSNDANRMMRSVTMKMTDEEISAVASYIAALP